MKHRKIMLFAMTAAMMLAGCGPKREPMEIYTSPRQEEQETAETVKLQVEQSQPDQENEQEQSRPDGKETENGSGDKENGKIAGDTYGRGAQIKDQTFQVTLNPLGPVTFASYEPDDRDNPLADAVFTIEKDGQILYRLSGMTEDNVASEPFHKVEAVSFTDYNSDSYDDIIIIISYDTGAGSQPVAPHSVIRYYEGNANGKFLFRKEMSQDATSALTEFTIQAAKDFIGPKGKESEKGGQETGDMSSWKQAYLDYLDKESDPEGQEGYTMVAMGYDEIPQLVEVGKSEASGCRIIYYGNGKVQVQQLSRHYFDYIPGKNLLRNAEGLMGNYYDLIYSMVDGRLQLIAEGYYGEGDHTRRQFDEEGNIIYQYKWNGTVMSREEYERELSNVYDTSQAISYSYKNLWSLEEAKKAVREY